MDELVQEKLKAKRRQDAVRPSPLSLDAIVCCTMLADMFKRGKKEEA